MGMVMVLLQNVYIENGSEGNYFIDPNVMLGGHFFQNLPL